MCFAINPFDSENLFFGTFYAGVFVSYDRGESWQSLNEGFPEDWANVETIGIDPINPNRYYVGTKGFSFYTYSKTETEINFDEEVNALPSSFSLSQNYPNPFNPSTDIRYQIADGRSSIHTTLKIYNVLGQEMKTLMDGEKEPGYYSVEWDGRDDWGREVASGVYFYRLRVVSGQWSETKKMVLLR
jgi:hypothetical protein